MDTMVSGALSFLFLIASGWCLYEKRVFWGAVCSLTAAVLTCLTGCSWYEMLAASGKNTALLGFHRYPIVVVLLVFLLLAALVSFVLSIVTSAKRKKGAEKFHPQN